MAHGKELVPAPSVLPVTLAQQLTDDFYQWERCGRGWLLWDWSVPLEPPFRSFSHAAPAVAADDARTPTLLGGLLERLLGRPTSAPAGHEWPASVRHADHAPPEPEDPADTSALVETHAVLPRAEKVSQDAAEQFLLSVSSLLRPLAFEVVGLADSITVQFVSRDDDHRQLSDQLRAHFADAVLTPEDGFLERHWDGSGAGETAVVDFGLSHEFMRPLKTYARFETDPLVGITGALADLQDDELGLLQVLFSAARAPWVQSVLRSVSDGAGGPFFADAPEMGALAREKVARPLFAAVIRVAARSPQYGRAWQIARALGGTLGQFANPLSNELIPLTNDGYPDDDHERDLLRRQTRRSGMLLNSEEVVSLVHLPSSSVRSAKLRREDGRTRAAPAVALGNPVVLGENRHAGRTVVVTLGPEQRMRHTYLIGASGTGKSTLLLNLIVQDIEQGQGVAVLDPHGDLVDQVLGHVPEARSDDVVLVDPSDAEHPVGFNILSAHSELEKTLLSSDLVAVFRRLATSWGDQMTSVLGNAILAILESEGGGTLLDLRRFLVEKEFRQAFLETVRDPQVVYYWEREFPLLAGRPQAPLLTRLDTFLRPKLVRAMVAQRRNRLDLGAIMNEGRILLAKLAQGAIGEENAALLGTLFVAKFHQLALGRQELAERQRRPFYLYIDEFHHFTTPSMAALLAGARKYRLGLTLAHQELRQLVNGDRDVSSAVLSNPATRVCFRVGDDDARKLQDGFSSFTAQDLQNLGLGEALCRIDRADHDFNLKTLPAPILDPALAQQRRERVVARSRERYGTSREDVEAELVQAGPAPPPRRERLTPDRRAVPDPIPREPRSRAKEQPPLPSVPSPGRGGPQHKYLQGLIKRWAEGNGYRATIEESILDGLGSVDVALEKDGLSVACEISVSSSADQELSNIQKCLAAGFRHVALVSLEKETLRQVKDALTSAVPGAEAERVRLLTPEDLFVWLEELDALARGDQPESREETVRGYRVKVTHRTTPAPERNARARAIAQTILGALRRFRGKEQ